MAKKHSLIRTYDSPYLYSTRCLNYTQLLGSEGATTSHAASPIRCGANEAIWAPFKFMDVISGPNAFIDASHFLQCLVRSYLGGI